MGVEVRRSEVQSSIRLEASSVSIPTLAPLAHNFERPKFCIGLVCFSHVFYDSYVEKLLGLSQNDGMMDGMKN